MFSLGQPMQDNAKETSAFMMFYFKMYLSHETVMLPIFLFSQSMLFGDKTAHSISANLTLLA